MSFKYQYVEPFVNDTAFVKKMDGWYCVNKKGVEFRSKEQNIKKFSYLFGNKTIAYFNDDKWYFINNKGEKSSYGFVDYKFSSSNKYLLALNDDKINYL